MQRAFQRAFTQFSEATEIEDLLSRIHKIDSQPECTRKPVTQWSSLEIQSKFGIIYFPSQGFKSRFHIEMYS